MQTSKQRLLALESMEAAAREEILLMDTVAKTSHQMLMETEKHLREKMEISLAVQKHRELSAEAELRMEERIRKLRLRRSRDDVRVDIYPPYMIGIELLLHSMSSG